MPEDTERNQQPSQRAEQERMERIAAVAQPDLRAELEALAKARDARLSEISKSQEARNEKDVAAVTETRLAAVRNPNYLGFPWSTSRAAAEQYVQVRNRTALEAAAQPYNEQIDERLDEHDQQLIAERGNAKQIEESQAALGGLRPQQAAIDRTGEVLEFRAPDGASVRDPQLDQQRPQPGTGNPRPRVDLTHAQAEPQTSEEVQQSEFRSEASEITRSAGSDGRTEPEQQSKSAEQEVTGASSPGASGIGARKEPEKEEPIDWQRAGRDPEYRREVLAREFDRTATELTQRADRRPTITQTY